MLSHRKLCAILGLLSATSLVFHAPSVSADTVYKCMKDGKASYSANPKSGDGECQETKIEEQNPEDFARALEEKRLKQEEERKAEEQRLKEREVRAKELEAAAAARAAQTAEKQLQLQNQPQPYESPMTGYPYPYAPYWGGIGPTHPLPPAGGGGHRHPPAAVGRGGKFAPSQPSQPHHR